jgi:hypothetical protein
MRVLCWTLLVLGCLFVPALSRWLYDLADLASGAQPPSWAARSRLTPSAVGYGNSAAHR